jgi:signal transduction histidine kinase
MVNSIYEDRSGMLWIGTYGGGLNKFDREQEKFTYYTENDGLPNSVIYGILEDDHGNFWLSTNNGLSKFNPQTKAFKNYDVYDGLQSNKYSGGAYFKSVVSGEMFFGGLNGFNAFHPDRVKDNPYIPPVVITALARYNTDEVAGKPIAEKGIAERTEIELSYKDNILTFEFAALNYRNTVKNQYAYKLEGFNDNWIQLGTKRDITFTNLDPGEYTLRVKGSNNDGVWNEEGLAIKIKINPPFWATWWFRILAMLGIGGSAWLIYERRMASLRKAKIAQEEFSRKLIAAQDRERKRIASELHDGLGQDLLIIKNGIQQYLGAIASRGQPANGLQELSEVAMTAINDVREISSNLHPHMLERLGLKKAIEASINKISQASPVKFSAEIDRLDGFIPKDLEIHVYRLIQEGLTNVVKHAAATVAHIRVQRDAQQITILIRDDGKGFDMANPAVSLGEKNGLGLTGISERARILGGNFVIDSAPGKGTRLEIVIPIEPLTRANAR